VLLRPSWRERAGTLPERLAAELRDAIVLGALAPGSLLPAERALAAQAEVSRSTVSGALDVLAGEGWIVRRTAARAVAALPVNDRQPLEPARVGATLDVRRALVAAPAAELAAALDRAHTRLVPHLLSDGRLAAGVDELRAAIAARFTADGLATDAAQVVVTNGSLGALNAVIEWTRGDALVEEPTYHMALRLLAGRRRRLVAWARTEHWDIEQFAVLQRRHRPALVDLVADFHNPTGRLASAQERAALADVVQPASTVVVDETLRDLDLRPEGTALPAHLGASIANSITIGSISKTIWSGLRVGWLRAPDAATAGALARYTEVQPVPVLDQLVALELMPLVDTIAAVRQARLRAQRDALMPMLAERGLAASVPDGGLSLWIDLGRPGAARVTATLAGQGILVMPGSEFAARGVFERHLRLPLTYPLSVAERVLDAIAATLPVPKTQTLGS